MAGIPALDLLGSRTVGVWGCVCELDHERLTGVVVPAFLTGEHHPVIRKAYELMCDRSRFPPEHGYRGLAGVMASVGEHAWSMPHEPPLWRIDPSLGWDEHELVQLFDWVVSREAVVSYAELGSAGNNPWRLFTGDLPDESPTGPVSRREELLGDLWRGSPWVSADSCGVRGWLDPAATVELATLLPRLGDEASEPRAQRAYWAVHDRAVANRNGLLWGTELALAHRPDDLFADGERVPEVARPRWPA